MKILKFILLKYLNECLDVSFSLFIGFIFYINLMFLRSFSIKILACMSVVLETRINNLISIWVVAEPRAHPSKDILSSPSRNGKDSPSASPRKESKESLIPRSVSARDSPRRDVTIVSLARSQSGKDLPRDSSLKSGLSKSHSGKDLVKDVRLTSRSESSMIMKSQSGRDIKDTMGLSPRHPPAKESSGSSSGKEIKDGGSPFRSVQGLSRTRRVGPSERRGLTVSSGSSDKEVSVIKVFNFPYLLTLPQ